MFSGTQLRGPRRWLKRLLPIASALSLVAGLIVGVHLLVAGWGRAPASSAGRAVPVHVVPGQKVRIAPMPSGQRPTAAWPAAGSGTAVIAAARAPQPKLSGSSALPTAGSSRAGNLPVWIGPPSSPAGQAAAVARTSGVAVAQVRVSVASRAVASALGVSGVVFSVSRADGRSAAGGVHVSLDYSAFADAYGGDYASRLRLVELPACAVSTPQVPACRTWTQLPAGSADSVRADRVGADVLLPGTGPGPDAALRQPGQPSTAILTAAVSTAASPPKVVLAALAGPAGSGGDYAAPPLSDASEWGHSGNSGAFTYSYPITVPPVPGGLEPAVNLGYDSQATDGLTSATNNETSWIGDGWDYSAGFIEAPLVTCSSGPIPDPSTGDLCATSSQPYTLNFQGSSSSLVSGKSGYRAEADAGAKISAVTPPGSNQISYWTLTATDGTQYYFGLNQLPGWVSGDPATNSAWSVPVWGGSVYNTQSWRWNLDYVVDPHGNAIAYFYNTQTSYYAKDNGSTGSAAYTQGGALSKIEYGLRAGSVYGATPAAQVNFSVSTTRQDAPDDLACSSGAACSQTSPTFWSDDALTGISTQSLSGGSLRAVDSWALAGSYPATGDPTTSPSLWLSSITHAGQDGAASITMPPTSFSGTPMPGRAETAADAAAGYSLLTRFRLTSVTNETGGVAAIAYSAPGGACAAGNFPSPSANTTACYPAYWLPPDSSSPVLDWFNLYPVKTTTKADTTGGDPPVVTAFTYAGAAWHYNNDSVVRSVTTTWDEWRGYQTVTAETGTSPDPVTETVGTYLQGMSGDLSQNCPLGLAPCNPTVTVTSSRGDTVTDSAGYAGLLLETIVYNGAGTGNQVTDTIHVPTGTMTGTSGGWASFMTEDNVDRTYTALAGGGTRESTQSYTYNTYGEALTVSNVPDTSNPAEDTCTTTTYDINTTTNLVDLPATLQVVDLPCGTMPSQASQLTSCTVNTYDNGSSSPTAGNLTKVQQATSATYNLFSGFVCTLVSTKSATYDQYGRPLTSTNADNQTTITAYTPATSAEPTSVQVTDPAVLVTITTYDPARDLPLTVTDPAGYQTTKAYDALGRETAQWAPGHPVTGPASITLSYTVSSTAPPVTTEQNLEPAGSYRLTDTINDSFGVVREVQQETAAGGTDVTDTTYDSAGRKALDSGPYYASGPPSGTLVEAASANVPDQTGYGYDGDGRIVRQVSYDDGTQTWETDTAYGGDHTTITPPAGGTPQTAWTDGRGLTTAVWQYHAGAPVSVGDPAGDYDATTYTYVPSGKLATITDAAGNAWSYTYDLIGDQLTATAPDTGKKTSTYDAAGRLMSVTDARAKATSYAYDADGRMTAKYDTTGGAPESATTELAAWTYDTLAKGLLTSATAYQSGSAYTTAVTGYNAQELPSGTEAVIPSSQGALAGTYATQYTYGPDGTETSYTDSAAGGLPAETVTTGYDAAGEPDSLAGTGNYVDGLTYTSLGQPLQYTMGSPAEPAYMTDSYDPQTRNLTEQDTQVGTAQTAVDDLHYSYNDVGDVTSEADTPSGAGAATDVQCFQYDYLNRLVQAWAQGSAGCASTPSASAEGGAAPYWESYAYSATGNLTGITSTTAAGAVTATADTYPAAHAAQPHAVTAQQVSSPSGETDTSYGHDAAGDLTAVTGPSSDQVLTWSDAGYLTQDAITPSSGGARDTTYTYSADGTLLLTADPGTTTLYLADEELSLNTATGTVTGTRYYTIDAGIVATRTGAATVDYLAGDSQKTDSIAIDSATLNVTRRYFDPYGNPLGPVPASFPAGQKGFVGGSQDTATGLTDLGAREYQPTTGSFISTDSVLEPYDPQDLDPYAYAEDNPATRSDPSGQASTGANSAGHCPPGVEQCGGGNCTVQIGVVSLPCSQRATNIYRAYVKAMHAMWGNTRNPSASMQWRAFYAVCGGNAALCGSKLSEATTKDYFLSIAAAGLLYEGLGGESDFPGEDVDEAVASLERGTFTDYGEDLSDEFGGCNSFTGSTRVLLADKTTVPIRAIKAGTEVLADNPPHGKPVAELVVRFIVTRTDKNFTNLTVKTPSGTAHIVSTSYHRYWDATDRQWTDAARLRGGDRLLTPNGQQVTVTGVRNYTGHAVTYNLTVDRLHTYYVTAGRTPVLVHNNACSAKDLAESFRDATVGKEKNVAAVTYDIGGVEGNAVTVSGKASRPGAVGMPQDPIFEVTRDAESEWKLLEYIAAKLKPGATGTINLYSERTVCGSCRSVIKQFEQKFPGVKINVSTGGG